MKREGLFGIAAEFESAPEVLTAARRAYAAGYRDMDAYTPFPVEDLPEALGVRVNRVALITLICALTGGATGYLMQYYSAVWDYSINVGGRPLHSWPSFIPITFELTVLFGSIGGLIGMFALNRLPRLNHPIFETPHFEQRNASRFYLCVEATDPKFDAQRTRADLEALNPAQVWEVPWS